MGGTGTGSGTNGAGSKKSSARRNAWGNLSYADLITQAIESTPDRRLTLSQVYEWMVQNIPYFKDKGDSNSSAGWKVREQHDTTLAKVSDHSPSCDALRKAVLGQIVS